MKIMPVSSSVTVRRESLTSRLPPKPPLHHLATSLRPSVQQERLQKKLPSFFAQQPGSLTVADSLCKSRFCMESHGAGHCRLSRRLAFASVTRCSSLIGLSSLVDTTLLQGDRSSLSANLPAQRQPQMSARRTRGNSPGSLRNLRLQLFRLLKIRQRPLWEAQRHETFASHVQINRTLTEVALAIAN